MSVSDEPGSAGLVEVVCGGRVTAPGQVVQFEVPVHDAEAVTMPRQPVQVRLQSCDSAGDRPVNGQHLCGATQVTQRLGQPLTGFVQCSLARAAPQARARCTVRSATSTGRPGASATSIACTPPRPVGIVSTSCPRTDVMGVATASPARLY